MNDAQQLQPPTEPLRQAFQVGNQMFVRLPVVGLCHLTSCGWTPCPEGVLDFHREYASSKADSK